ncbi:TPA: hypothetical protein MXU26_002484 [Pseudomonas aeruginosa]|nr:hypothetical protein [Pseudomonas aeruginosa]HCA6413685.1 hypothetical protein [Pseudomonas aeruginosa]HCA6437022.1 hypothetical protein [Pseudomonas aeruginosa]HCA6597071.1 hypothetical protein [Pseudomonas aeruginosa]HCA6666433.1 hypothetical protein [Pseudomonas aeruginosa]
MKIKSLLALAFTIVSPAFADVKFHNANLIADYKQNKAEYSTYLNGVMNGLFWANSYTMAVKNVKIFCLPENLSPSDIDYVGILDRHISSDANADKEKYIEMALVASLTEKFPCN